MNKEESKPEPCERCSELEKDLIPYKHSETSTQNLCYNCYLHMGTDPDHFKEIYR